MPVQQMQSHKYWCPEWLNPFKTCNRESLVWTYHFSWLEENGWGAFSYLKGCENGTLYTWYEFSFLVFGKKTYPDITKSFDTQKSSEGKCDTSNTGLYSQPLTGDNRIIITLKIDISKNDIVANKKYTPIDPICNKDSIEIESWVVVKDYVLQYIPNKVVGEMLWFIDGQNLKVGNSNTTLILVNKSTYILKDDLHINKDINISFTVDSNDLSLTILTDGTFGDFSFDLELRVKRENDVNTFGTTVFKRMISIDSQSKDGNEKYHDYLNCRDSFNHFKDRFIFKEPIISNPGDPVSHLTAHENRVQLVKNLDELSKNVIELSNNKSVR